MRLKIMTTILYNLDLDDFVLQIVLYGLEF